LLESATQACADRSPVLMLAYDSEYPEPLHASRPIPDVGGIALVLSPTHTQQARARLQIQVRQESRTARSSAEVLAGPHTAHAAASESTTWEDLPNLIPALAGLLLLDALANRRSGVVDLPYFPGQSVAVRVQPC
jgi:hypothetical protein